MSGPPPDHPAAQLPVQPLQIRGQMMQDLAAMSARQVVAAAQDQQLVLPCQQAAQLAGALQQLMGGPLGGRAGVSTGGEDGGHCILPQHIAAAQ